MLLVLHSSSYRYHGYFRFSHLHAVTIIAAQRLPIQPNKTERRKKSFSLVAIELGIILTLLPLKRHCNLITRLDCQLFVAGILGLCAADTSTLTLWARALSSLCSTIALCLVLVGRSESVYVHRLSGRDIILAASGASTCLLGASTATSICLTPADSLVGIGVGEVVKTHVVTCLAALLLLLDVCKMTSLVVNVHDSFVALVIEGAELLSSWGVDSLVEVAGQCCISSISLLCNAELVIDSLCLLCSLGLGVEVLEGLLESGAVSVLLIRSKGRLDSFVGDHVAVREIFGDDAGTGLRLLLDVVVAILGFFCGGNLLTSNLINRLC